MMCFASASSAPRDLNDQSPVTNPVAPLEKLLLEAGLPAWMLGSDGDLSFEAEEVSIGTEKFRQVNVPISFNQNGIHVKEASFVAFEGDANLSVSIDRARQAFTAQVQLNNVHLKTEQDLKPTDDTHEFIFSEMVLVPAWAADLTGSIDVAAINSQVDDIELRDVRFRADSDRSSLSVKINGTTNNGNLQGEISHRFDTQKTNIDIQGQSVPLSLLPVTREYVEHINLDFRVDVVTSGTSARQWVSAMDGKIITEFDGGKINIKKLDKLSQDILSLTLTSLLPISLGPSHSNIECGAIVLKPAKGIALDENAIALRTENLAIMGGGEINFAAEQLAIALRPHARKSGKLNTKTAIKEVSIHGPFQDLEVKPHLGGIINQGISLTTKIANFGLSKIGVPLLDWAAPADVACMKSLH